MGNKGASSSKSDTVLQEQQITIDHPKLKDIKFLRTKGGEYMEAKIPMHNKKDFEQWKQQSQKDPGSSNVNVLSPVKSNFKDNKMCSSGGQAYITYQNYPYLLSYQITNRRILKNKRKFEQNQIWYLLLTLADVGESFHKSGEKVGNIDPRYVFMNEDGMIKIATKFSWPNEKTNYENAMYDKQVAYLAPEEYRDLEAGRKAPIGDFRQAESFSAGLTVLDAVQLGNCSKLYSPVRGFQEELLEGKRENLKHDIYYNDELKHVILNLTEIDPNKRMSLIEVKEWLSPNTQDIMNLHTFRPKHFPPKLRETADQNPIRKRVQQPNTYDTYQSRASNMNLDQYESNQKVQSKVGGKPQYDYDEDYKQPNSKQNRVTKTIEIPGGPTKSFRPKKSDKVGSGMSGNYNQIFNIYSLQNSKPIQSVQPVQSQYYPQKNPTEYINPSRQEPPRFSNETNVGKFEGSALKGKGKSSLEMIEQKIRQSRRNFPSQ